MRRYASPLHIISAQVSELGITFASKSADGKSNEIPAVQQLIAELNLQGCMIVADALSYQKESAEAVVKGKDNYLLDAKGNQTTLEHEIREYVQDESLRKALDCGSITERSWDRIETRTAILQRIQTGQSKSFHYGVASSCPDGVVRGINALASRCPFFGILPPYSKSDHSAKSEYAQNIALSLIKQFKASSNSKRPISQIMFNCLLDPPAIPLFLKIDFRVSQSRPSHKKVV